MSTSAHGVKDGGDGEGYVMAYQVERADLTGTFGYMCSLIGIEAGFVGTAFILVAQFGAEIDEKVLALLPVPFIAVAGLVLQSWGVLVVHGQYARDLERRLTDDFRALAPIGSNMTEFLYGGKVHSRVKQKTKGALRWIFLVTGSFPIFGSFVALGVLVAQCLVFIDSNGLKYVTAAAYSTIGLMLLIAAGSLLCYEFTDYVPPDDPSTI